MYFFVRKRNSDAHLKRVLEVAWYGHLGTHNLHTLDPVQLDAAFHHGLFLKHMDMIHIIVGQHQEAECTGPASGLYHFQV